jgi:hypothetical protein
LYHILFPVGVKRKKEASWMEEVLLSEFRLIPTAVESREKDPESLAPSEIL